MGVIAPQHQQSNASVADALLGSLHERHGRHVLRFCRRHTRSDAEADDAFQLTFVQAMRGLRDGVVPQYELAWLLGIARNVCREQWRTQQRRPRLVDDLDAVPDDRTPFDSNRTLALDLSAALAQLSERHRIAIVLREWRGLSYAEIATQMGLTEPAVETMLVRARRELAAALEQGAQPKKRRASWRDLGWLADLVRRVAAQGAGAKLVAGAAVVTAAVSAAGASPAESQMRGATHRSPTVAQTTRGSTGHRVVPTGQARRRDAVPRSGAGVATAPPGATAVRPTSIPPVAPQQPDTTTPPQRTSSEPTSATGSTAAQVPPATATVPAVTARAPSLAVASPTVDLPGPLPSLPTVSVTTPGVDVQTRTTTVDLLGKTPGPTGT